MISEDLDPPFNFDLDTLKASIESGTITFPRGLTGEERRVWCRARLSELDAQKEVLKDSQ